MASSACEGVWCLFSERWELWKVLRRGEEEEEEAAVTRSDFPLEGPLGLLCGDGAGREPDWRQKGQAEGEGQGGLHWSRGCGHDESRSSARQGPSPDGGTGRGEDVSRTTPGFQSMAEGGSQAQRGRAEAPGTWPWPSSQSEALLASAPLIRGRGGGPVSQSVPRGFSGCGLPSVRLTKGESPLQQGVAAGARG